jgi:hypothetical protein
MDKLFYIDVKNDAVLTTEYNRARAMSVSPIFYNDKVKALMALKDRCEERANHYTCRLMQIEMDIAKEKSERKN